MTENQIKEYFAAQFAADKVTVDEIFLLPNGEVVIDRSATIAWAKPVSIGRWKA